MDGAVRSCQNEVQQFEVGIKQLVMKFVTGVEFYKTQVRHFDCEMEVCAFCSRVVVCVFCLGDGGLRLLVCAVFFRYGALHFF